MIGHDQKVKETGTRGHISQDPTIDARIRASLQDQTAENSTRDNVPHDHFLPIEVGSKIIARSLYGMTGERDHGRPGV